ncbi:MAG: hypothetical protein ACXWN5_05375 [Candidatus Limnocylindrales bacterium]
MGLLDDAIRDHLDLKRRRGADPAEVERAEREALGPVRRNPTPADLPPDGEAAVQEGAAAYDQAGDENWSHDSLQEPAAGAGIEPAFDEPVAEPLEAPRAFSEAAPLDDVQEPPEEEPYEQAPAHAPFPAPSASPPGMGGVAPETAEYNVEDALAAEEDHDRAGDGEDVLEETPEFLQDTPDHDRLWFEQRPPKDFDFDE